MSVTQSESQQSLFGDVQSILRSLDAAQSKVETGAHLPPCGEKTVSADPAERRDEGMASAIEHADAVELKWSARAAIYTRAWLRRRGDDPFLTEDLVETAKAEGFPEPPDKRAWGGVIRQLAKEKAILKLGFALARTSNLSPKVEWKRNPDWTK